MTSHDVVAHLRKILKIKQIGHTGTLDPFAEGVLPICIGKATRLIEYFADDKEYLATVQFGSSTSTFDIEGEKTFTSDKKVFENDIINELKNFEGEILQTPPIYSAIKVNGKKLYDYAREGKTVEIKPRKVFIENIELKTFDENIQQAQILIKCSKGTYIRSIADDLGKSLGCGGHLVKLIRTQAGNFRVENSKKLDEINISSDLINPLEMINIPKIEVTKDDIDKIKHGIALDIKNMSKNFTSDSENFVILVYNHDKICAVGCTNKNEIKMKKVFVE